MPAIGGDRLDGVGPGGGPGGAGSFYSVGDESVVSLVASSMPGFGALHGGSGPPTPTSRYRAGAGAGAGPGPGAGSALPPVRGTHRRGGRGSRSGARHQRDDGTVRHMGASASLVSLSGNSTLHRRGESSSSMMSSTAGRASAAAGVTTGRHRSVTGRAMAGVMGTQSASTLPRAGASVGSSSAKLPLGAPHAKSVAVSGNTGGARHGWAAPRAAVANARPSTSGDATLNPDGSKRRTAADPYHEDDEELQLAALRTQALGDGRLLPFEKERQRAARRKRRLERIDR